MNVNHMLMVSPCSQVGTWNLGLMWIGPYTTKHVLHKKIMMKHQKKHNIIQIHNNVMWEWHYYTKYSSHSDWMWEIFYKRMSVTHNIVMELNNVMSWISKLDINVCWIVCWIHRPSQLCSLLSLKKSIKLEDIV
jgi:hypothetical protein